MEESRPADAEVIHMEAFVAVWRVHMGLLLDLPGTPAALQYGKV
jgi:hypothetical protein